ncbi:MAG: PSD1 and planctomycete cytochrome C domain-containing protein, partial [Gemmataceae bacterium]|nr:PSD1 and planctomycete cytochrome C domain-containing protein [Gemmataceae bacterium]
MLRRVLRAAHAVSGKCASVLALVLVFTPGVVIAQTPAPADIEFFEKRVRPLLVEQCYGCHSKDAKKLRGDLRLDTRDGARKALVPGKPDDSLLVKAVRYDDPELRMPPNGKLAAAQIADLEKWVKIGAPDPRTDKAASVAKAGIDWEKGRKHWAYQPLKDHAPPKVDDAAWSKTAIDRFVRARLEEKGLQPVAPADRRTLIRRATFDLTGLPPTPEEIDAFLKDEAPDAFANVVERLLASSAYGERWGRHWLDVVRYADTAGDNSDYPIPQMYKYRDWVIDAFNRDMPYDQFVREQLAGDLMSPVGQVSNQSAKKDGQVENLSYDKVIATGYLANSRRHGSYEDKRYPWHLTIEDTLDNFGKAFLGMTLGCARCHDHKFDPIGIEDYYALYGFFSSTRYPWPGIELEKYQRDLVPLALPAEVEKVTKEKQKRLAELDKEIKQLEKDKGDADRIKALKKEREQVAKAPLPFQLAYAVIDGRNEPNKRIGQVGDVCVQLKGDPDRPGKMVARRFPLILGGQTLGPDTKGSGRLELAQWLTSPDNPLFARVMVNRIWQYHFGKGLVETPNDFGKQGRPPTHTELLDYLAKQFIQSGWSVKSQHRLILSTRAYQMSSQDNEANAKADPDNDLLWQFSRRRLDAESIRDAILAVSGTLDRSRGGAHPFPEQAKWDFTQHKPFKAVYDTKRRSVYLMTQRIQRHPFLAMFDGPDTNASTANRLVSTTPLQALYLMNDPFVHEQSRQFAARLLRECKEDEGRVERAFLLVYGRPPADEERRQANDYLAQIGKRLTASGLPNEQRAARVWESFARVLF